MLTPTILDQRQRRTPAWWAVYTRHQHEKTVAEMLSTKGFEVFLPLHESMRRWKDRQKAALVATFSLLRLCAGKSEPAVAGGDHAGNSHDSLPG